MTEVSAENPETSSPAAAPTGTVAPVGTAAESSETTGSPTGPPGRRWRRCIVPWNFLLVGGAAAAMLVLGYRRRWVTDDALIFTHTVRQILLGNGPVYSPGERAEASTSTLWQWILTAAGFATGNTDTSGISWRLGLALTTLGIAIGVDATRRLHRPDSGPPRLLLPAGVLVYLALPPAWDYATSGLETGLTTFWIASCWWLLVRLRDSPRRRLWLSSALVFGLGPLVRPDMALASACFLAALWLVLRPSWRGTVAAVAAAGALPVGYEIFRMGYYGLIFPMPALTKEANSSLWGRGATYVQNMNGTYWLWLPMLAVAALLAAAIIGLRRDRKTLIVVLTPVVTGAVLTLYVVKVGGDYMHGRMMLPPLLLMLLPFFVVPAARVTAWAATAVLTAWAVTCTLTLRPESAHMGKIDDERRYYITYTHNPHPLDSGDYAAEFVWLKEIADAELAAGRKTLVYLGPRYNVLFAPARPDLDAPIAVVAAYLGASPTVLPDNARLVDYWGLVNPIGAHLELERVDKPGHEKPIGNEWVLADYADPNAPVLPFGSFERRKPFTPAAVEAARQALRCGDLKELQESTREPMSVKRFWKNLTGSFKRTQLRIPNDPFEAERKFCGTGGK
ncbi:MAG: hypothetical protein HOV68_31465 [Streptomycetaceae bacterium]|nr:hypothetical protein [Streptomycetaceae bacterium]